jgi:hypothetical protein
VAELEGIERDLAADKAEVEALVPAAVVHRVIRPIAGGCDNGVSTVRDSDMAPQTPVTRGRGGAVAPLDASG